MLYARHRRALYAYLARLLPPGAGSVDDLFRKCGSGSPATWRYRPGGLSYTWLFLIARNLAIDLVRRHRPLLASRLQNAEDDGDPLERIADKRRRVPMKRSTASVCCRLQRSRPAGGSTRRPSCCREYGEHSVGDP